jgi:predicted nucleic acid-binding protein
VAEAETQAAENLKSASNNNYWVVKSYLLLADIMLQQKDYFNAKATLQSIVKNTKFEDLKTEATTKLTALKAIEKKQSKLSDK